jgi:hypothetical protein
VQCPLTQCQGPEAKISCLLLCRVWDVMYMRNPFVSFADSEE